MKVVRFNLEPSLHPLLKRDLREMPVRLQFRGPQSIKHLIESLGIPHTEVGQLSANGISIGLDYIVQHGDALKVEAVASENSSMEPRFVLDGHLGRLTSHLRMLGLDCLYDNEVEDDKLARISVGDKRILLTRDRQLLMRKTIKQGYLLRSLNSNEQLTEVVQRYGLAQWVKPFQRCMRCNYSLEYVEKEMVLAKLEPLTKKYFDEFKQCVACKQVYWKGSHYEKMLNVIEQVCDK